MIFGSVCSGIEAASTAWLPLGWQCAFMSEIEAFPRAVLAHHYPEAPLHGDFTTIREGEYRPIDALVGGTPCQSFSVAGLRGGMADERGNLALEYLRLAERLRPRWVVWENVPGVLSSAGGRDFGSFVGGLAELGYGWAYRVLDAQYFGLAQRRKRVFVVGYLGDWRRAAAVLFEPASLRWHPAPSRTKGERVADSLTVGANQCSGRPGDFVSGTLTGNGNAHSGFKDEHGLVANPLGAHDGGYRLDLDNETFVSMSLNAHGRRMDGESETFVTPQLYSFMPQNTGRDFKARPVDVSQPVMASGQTHGDQGGDVIVTHSLRADGFDASEDGTGRGTPLVAYGKSLHTTGHQGDRVHGPGDVFSTLPNTGGNNGGGAGGLVETRNTVRRLTPRECERLQGFSDNYTLIPYRGKLAADGPRYRALGNSMAVPVMAWIGHRIEGIAP